MKFKAGLINLKRVLNTQEMQTNAGGSIRRKLLVIRNVLILVAILACESSCDISMLKYTIPGGMALRTLTVYVDDPEAENPAEYYIRVGTDVYKVIALVDDKSIIIFKCPKCGLRFGINPTADDVSNVAMLVCPRCRQNVAVLHERLERDNRRP